MKKYIITIVTVTLVVLTVALGGFYYLTKDDKATTPNSSNQKQDSKTSTNKENDKNKNGENESSTLTKYQVSEPTILRLVFTIIM